MLKSSIALVLGMCTSVPAKTACEQRCTALAGCMDEWTAAACTDDCDLHPHDAEVADCIVRAGCAGYRRRLAMDLDLRGLCEADARR